MARKIPQLKQLMGKPVVTIDIGTLVSLLHVGKNRYIRVIWESNQNKRLKKTGEGAKYKGREVTKLYCLTARNNFSFENSVRAELARQGETEAAAEWEGPGARAWGEHIETTPFVWHECKGEPRRLHGHFLPAAVRDKSGKIVRTGYHFIDGETGFYVDGEKGDETELRALQYERKKPEGALEEAKQRVHPVNCRLDDILYIRIDRRWFRLKQPSDAEIETLTAAARAYGEAMKKAA